MESEGRTGEGSVRPFLIPDKSKNMLVKITQPGWEKFNDFMYGVPFKDGVSQDHLTHWQAMQLGAMLPIVEVNEAGEELGPVNPAHEIVQTRGVSAEVVEPMKTAAQIEAEQAPEPAQEDEGEAQSEGEGDPAPDEQEPTPKVWTQEELEEIASQKGISGLREIATPMGVKDNSIRGLIREILAAQNGQ